MAGHRASNQQRGDRGHLGRKIKQSTLMREGTANRNLGRRKGCTEKWVNSHHKAWHEEKFIGNQVYQHNWGSLEGADSRGQNHHRPLRHASAGRYSFIFPYSRFGI